MLQFPLFLALCVPLTVFGLLTQNGPCFQLDNICFDPREEAFCFALDRGMECHNLWDPFIFCRNGFFKNCRRFSRECGWRGTTIIFSDQCVNFLSCPFHFFEHLIPIWEFGGCEGRWSVEHIVFCAQDSRDCNFCWEGLGSISKIILAALFPNAEICTLHTLKKRKHPICMSKVLFSSRFVSYRDSKCIDMNKMMASTWESISIEKLDRLRAEIFSFCHVVCELPKRDLRITYLHCPPPRRIAAKLEKRFLSQLSNLVGYAVCRTDLVQMPFEEQLQVIANTDVLISVHGSGLSCIPFLPRWAIVIEIFPEDCWAWDHYLLAQICKLDYWGCSGHFWVTPSHPPFFIPHGDLNCEVNDLNVEAILAIIAEKICREATSRREGF